MGSAQSKTAARDRRQRTRQPKKRQPIKSEVHSNGPIKEEHSQNGPIKTKHRSNGDKNQKSKEPIKSQDSENQPIREKYPSKESILTVDRTTNTESKDQPQKSKNRKNGEAAKEKPGKKNEKSKRKDDATEKGKPKPKRLSHRKQKEQIEKEKKQQRVTKEQLRSLASSLRRTSWYLGKKIGMEESQIKRYDVGFATEEERKYQMLLWWRRVRGWKATEQQLVILLELGNYSEDEYSAILTSSNGDVTIYEKAPDIAQEEDTTKDNAIREPYHSDVIKPDSRSYGNMCYDDAIEAQLYEKKKQDEKHKRREGKRETRTEDERKKEHQKQRSRHRSRDTNDNSLPPWWKKPGDTLERPTKRKTKEEKYTDIPKKTSTENEPITEKKEIKESQQMHDGTQSSASHTDDSGIVTSPPMSPKQIANDQSEPETSEENDRKSTKPDESTTTKTKESTAKTGEAKRSSKKLIVRRCSDSVVKLRYSSLMDEKPRIAKPVEPAIKEYESGEESEQIFPQNNASHNDVTNDNSDITNDNSDVTRTHNGENTETHHANTNKDSDVTRTRMSTSRKKRRDGTESTDDITKRQHDNVARSQPHEVSRSYDDITDNDDVTNSNCDLTKQGYQSDIRGMVKKYESLSKLHEAQNRESMALSIQRHWENTNSSLPREFSQRSRHASRTSLSSTGSRSTTLSKTSASRHGTRSSTYMQRYHFFSFGGKGKFPSRFKGLISGLAILGNGNVVASDGDNKRIQIFDKRGKFLTTFDTNTELKPKGVCVTPDERIAVCCGDAVNVYDRDGHLHLSFGQGVFRNNSYCVCCDPKGNYYVTDIVSHTISIHDARGRIRKRFGFLGDSMIHFNQPVSLVINKKNQLFITDSQNHCIKVYSLSGRPLSRIGAKGSSDGLFWNPLGICLDDNDHLYVADCGNNRISEFDSDGIFMRQVLTESDGIWMPSLIQVNTLGQLVICEWEKQLIKVFTIETSV